MIALLSGGLDSTVLVAHMIEQDPDEHVEAVSIAYGQRHARELEAAKAVAAWYGIRHDIVDLSGLGQFLPGSALTSPSVPVPEGHYAAPSMAATVVPNRNMIMLAVTAGIAAARGHKTVATAVHAGDHPIYPDCRPEFIQAVSQATQLGTAGYGDVMVHAPFAMWTKTEIVTKGTALSVPFRLTWSCYAGGARHCGKCGTCVERWEAFRDAGVPDPTAYEDTTFAEQALAGN